MGNEWEIDKNKSSLQIAHDLVESMPCRIKAVLKVKGGQTQY